MESDEFRTVRVYTKKYTSKDKDGNTVEKESQQKQVSLKKEDPFEDDDLVKVLNRQHIILKIQCISSNRHHSVCIDLSHQHSWHKR